jgi:hypothetical protein
MFKTKKNSYKVLYFPSQKCNSGGGGRGEDYLEISTLLTIIQLLLKLPRYCSGIFV